MRDTLRGALWVRTFSMARPLVVSCVTLLVGCALCGRARAQSIERRPRYEVVTTLPTVGTAPAQLATYDPRLLVHSLGLDVRTFWLSPRVELSFAQGTKLVALDVLGLGKMSFTPTSFGGGTLTISAPF